VEGLEIHLNHLEIVSQVIILMVLKFGFCPALLRAFKKQSSE
jgi:hypothetical protein